MPLLPRRGKRHRPGPYHGISIKGATLYTTFSPCLLCAKMIINGGIAEVVFNEHYTIDGTARRILQEAGVILRALPGKGDKPQ